MYNCIRVLPYLIAYVLYYNKCPCVNVNLLVSFIPSVTEHFVLGVRKPLVCRKRGTFGPTVLSDYGARNRARDKLASAVCSVRVPSRVEYPGSWITWLFRKIEDWQSTLPHVICRLAYFGSCTRTRRSELSGRRSIFRAIGRADSTCGSVRAVGWRPTPGP